MRVYIPTDMEGTAGIVNWEQVKPGTEQYEETRRLQMAEVNAAVEGALAAGAERVLVADLHWSGCNFPVHMLHGAAEYYEGSQPPYTRFPCMHEGFDVLFCTGYHAKAHTPAAILSHTMSPQYYLAFRMDAPYRLELELDTREIIEKKLAHLATARLEGRGTIVLEGDDLNRLMFDILV